MSPWMRELSGFSATTTTYRVCGSCGTGYFVHIPSDVQLGKLYQDYRGPRYVSVRKKWERTYTSSLNAQLSSGTSFLAPRREALESFLNETFPGISADCIGVVDVGGGEGYLMPSWESIRSRFVLDISGITSARDIKQISTMSEVGDARITLVQFCGVLEHVANPATFVRETVSWLMGQAKGLVILIEVPAGVPEVRGRYIARLPGIGSITRARALWQTMDRLDASTGALRKQWPLRMGEHLNFFSQDGLQALFERIGVSLRGMRQHEIVGLESKVTVRFERSWAVAGFLGD